MRLIEAMEAAEKDPDKAYPIRAGQCEAKTSSRTQCGADGRWWVRHQFRCSEHKTTP